MYIHYFLYTNALLNVGYVVIHYLKADKIFKKKYFISFHSLYLQPIITQYFIDNKSEIWLLFLIAHSKR